MGFPFAGEHASLAHAHRNIPHRFVDRSPGLNPLIRDRNAAQKRVWRAEIILLSSDGVGTVEIMRQTGKSKTCVWRWQERFAAEGFEGLLRDKTRPSRIAPPGPAVAERLVALTLQDPPGEDRGHDGASGWHQRKHCA
ncbi:hypothetical protein MesoLj131c_68880 (plasmid) [Mesorhizobium sp. 131-3-5]|nr:hypothetical protein MesoLj131c_68880 [Mesorhizobium sp. 131-3-5]